jgi:shikimate dehydrogenase
MSRTVTGATRVAGIAGAPVAHSLSPLIHNAWIEAAGLDAIYVPFAPPGDGFARFADGLRGGAVCGINVTVPFKEAAAEVCDTLSDRARAAGAANLLIFQRNGVIMGDNTDGEGMLGALGALAGGFDPKAGPVVILGAGGASRGAAAAFAQQGAPAIRIVNRTLAKAEMIVGALTGNIEAYPLDRCEEALRGAAVVINATTAGLEGNEPFDVPLAAARPDVVVMDMVYKPLVTPLLAKAQGMGLRTVDGLEMLIRQAGPSFEAFFGQPPPPGVDVRALSLASLAK